MGMGEMKKVLVIGGAGYFGTVLKNYLISLDCDVVTFDRLPVPALEKKSVHVLGDIRKRVDVETCLAQHGPFDCVFHVAAELAHEMASKQSLWETNVDGTRIVAECCITYGVKKLVYTSTNCLWGKSLNRAIPEEEIPHPIEIYGQSKWEAEKILIGFKDKLHSSIIRCPTIISAKRLGLLSILFEFIDENKRVYVVGKGDNRYQFVYAQDVAAACWLSASQKSTEIYNVGSDNVNTMRDIYSYVINESGSHSSVCSVPKTPTILLLQLAHKLNVSPLGPYHYKMIAENFIFDTQKIKNALGWKPTKTNEEMLYEAYEFYRTGNNGKAVDQTGTSPHPWESFES
jgi:UDP-glucose 4-epimerase